MSTQESRCKEVHSSGEPVLVDEMYCTGYVDSNR